MKNFHDKYCDSIIKKVKPLIIFNFLTMLIVMQGSIFKWKYVVYFMVTIMIFYILEFIAFIPLFIEVILFCLKNVFFDKCKTRKE